MRAVGLRRALDLDPADRRLRELLAQELAHREVRVQVVGVVRLSAYHFDVQSLMMPSRMPSDVLSDPYLTRSRVRDDVTVMWLVRLKMRLARPLARGMSASWSDPRRP
jgi:hypothetical protein